MPRAAISAEENEHRTRDMRHGSLPLSEPDRAAFFEALIHAPNPNVRLRRAFRLAEERVTPSRLEQRPTKS